MKPHIIAAFSIGPVVGVILGVITVPVITWFYAVEDIGRLAMLQISMSFGVLLFSLGLDQAYVREYHDAEDHLVLLKTTFVPGAVLLGLVLGGLLLLPDLIAWLLFGLRNTFLSVLVALCVLTAFISRFLSLILRMQERGMAYSVGHVVPKIAFLSVIGTYAAFEFGFDPVYLVLAHTLSILAASLIYGWNTRRHLMAALVERIDVVRLRAMLQFGWPLVVGGIAFWGLTAVDKLLLRSVSTFDQLGMYSVAVSFAGVAVILQNVFSTVWAPTVYKWVSNREEKEKVEPVIRYVLVAVLLVYSMAGAFSWIIDYVLPSTYANIKYILVACLGYPLLYTLSEATKIGIGIGRKTQYSMIASIIAFGVNVLGNVVLIPLYGAAGAAVSTGVAFWVFLVLRTEFSIYLWMPIQRGALYSLTLFAVGLASITALYGQELGYSLHVIWTIVLVLVLTKFSREVRNSIAWSKTLLSRERLGIDDSVNQQ